MCLLTIQDFEDDWRFKAGMEFLASDACVGHVGMQGGEARLLPVCEL